MYRRHFLLAITLLILVISSLHAQDFQKVSADQDGPSIWEIYQDSLVKLFSTKYPKYKADLNDEGESFTHIVTQPTTARWHINPSSLSNEMCRFPPLFSLSYELKGSTDDSSIPSIYQKAVQSLPNPTPFINFRKSSANGFNWIEQDETLASFVNRVSKKPDPISFKVEGRETAYMIPEETFAQLKKTGSSFLTETVDHVGKPFVRIEEVSDDDDDQYNGGPIGLKDLVPWDIIETQYKVDFKAQGIAAIKVRPDSWFDKDALKKYQSSLKGYFSPDGKFPLIQSIFWLVTKPRVELEMKEEVFSPFWQTIQSKKVRVSVGSLSFTTGGKSDDDSDEQTDSASFQVVNRQVSDDDEIIGSIYNLIIPKKLSSSKTYKLTLESNSDIPQVVAITSDLLPN